MVEISKLWKVYFIEIEPEWNFGLDLKLLWNMTVLICLCDQGKLEIVLYGISETVIGRTNS